LGLLAAILKNGCHTPCPTGSLANKWIITGRPQQYSAHYVCNPPMGAATPIVGPWSKGEGRDGRGGKRQKGKEELHPSIFRPFAVTTEIHILIAKFMINVTLLLEIVPIV